MDTQRDYIKPQLGSAVGQHSHNIVASELKDPISHSSEWQIGSFNSEATVCTSPGLIGRAAD